MADETAIAGAPDCVYSNPSLMRQERQPDGCPGDLVRGALPATHRSLNMARPPIQKRSDARNSDRQRGGGPHSWCTGNEPPQQEKQQRRHGDQASSQIVEDSPAAYEGQRICYQVSVPPRNFRQNPAGDLPISAGPTMLPANETAVVQREVFQKFDIRSQPYPSE